MAITDDAVRERHGVKAISRKDACDEIILREWECSAGVSIGYQFAELTPYQARYLAAKLYRLARRIRQRTETEA